jgi:hypothetical protein
MLSNNAVIGDRTARSSGVAAWSEGIRKQMAVVPARRKDQRRDGKIFMRSIVN